LAVGLFARSAGSSGGAQLGSRNILLSFVVRLLLDLRDECG
jgi:hypothetical protein